MVKPNPKYKWMRRYRTFFVIGIVILSFQIFLAVKFVSISKNVSTEENQWGPSNSDNEGDQEIESNSARRIKLEDDEDIAVSSKTKLKPNQTHYLRYEDLEFKPPCQIVTKDAISAINRAKTQKCKQLISNITCLSLVGKLYPTELKGSCPAKGYVAGRELGCFKDDKNYRLLSGYVGSYKKDNSPKFCRQVCLQSGFPYAGVEYSYECFCGIDQPPLSYKIPDSSCNLKCPGNSKATCGGYYTINIFETGIKRFAAQIANTEDRKYNSPVRIVFLLTLNGRAVRQVRRLLKIIYHRDHYYYIHVDVRQNYLFRELLPLEQQLPNVRLTRKRFATIWGGASLLEMLRSCMWELLNLNSWHWDFVLNLSESDFPVKTISQLTEFLSMNTNKNFVKSHGREVQRFIQKQGLDKTFVECETRMWRIGDRILPYGIQVDGGSDWISLSRPFVEYVANPEPDELITGLLKIFKHTLLPAESFFHTALRNSKYCDTYVDNNLHVTNWKRKLGCKCQYKHVVDWCGCSPNDFRPEDWPRIQNTLNRQLYFARKFEPIINQAVILQLELWLFNLEQPSRRIANLHGYWQNEFHHHDLSVAPNDALLTISNSIKRNLLKLLMSTFNSTCDLDVRDLFQVNTFHYNDTYMFNLFNYKLDNVSVEVTVEPKLYLRILDKSPIMERLDLLIVSSDYDQKEQTSRNFLRILSPQSEPVLVYQFRPKYGSSVYNLTSLWISPAGHFHDSVEFSVDENSLIGHVKPILKVPVLPGNWTVLLLYKDTKLAILHFLVMPLELYSGSPIKQNQAIILNGGNKPTKTFSTYNKFLPSEEEKRNLTDLSQINSRKFGEALNQWVDRLFSVFYKIRKLCVSSDSTMSKCGMKFGSCKNTNWSSYALDPKSAIGVINETTGTFNIW